MATFTLNKNNVIGKIKPMHAVGQPPFMGVDTSMFAYLTEAGIPYSRLHDVGGGYGGGRYVDIPNIFRNFDADETLPESYDFAFTDVIIKGLVDAGVEPFYRLGVTIENYCAVKAYFLDPPKDPAKWARICEHIIMHYTEGWADGFNYDITYWEIWNEPDNSNEKIENQMWWGTKEEYFELYDITAKHLKARFPHLKIGGFASCGFYAIADAYSPDAKSTPRREYFVEFFHDFLKYVKKSGAPLDFFSWHSYDNKLENLMLYAKYAREQLDLYGFTETETTCNEWNADIRTRGTPYHAAKISSLMLAMQNSPLDSAMFYDARCGASWYGSMFDPMTRLPFPTFYAFTAFNRLYKLGDQIELTSDISGDVQAIAASGKDGTALVIANPTGEELPLVINGAEPLYYTVTDIRGNDRHTEYLTAIPAESIVSVIFR